MSQINTTIVPIHVSDPAMTTTPLSNWTFEDLQKLNDAKAEALMPAMLVIGLYMVVGIIGNSLVCYIMGFKLKMNTQNMLIIYLAVFDLLNCLVCMPADIHDMRSYYYFPSEVGCKIVRMVMSFVSEASILTLIVIAVDRFRKICKPMSRQINLRHTKWFLILVIFGALLLSWPALIIFGFRTVQTGIPGIPGHDCSISNSLKGTLYPMIYTSMLFLLFIVLCVCLIVLYSFVLAAARRHRSYTSSNSNPNHFTYPSIRRFKYTKNNYSSSMTITTDDTTSDLKESSESISHKDLSKVNTNKDHKIGQGGAHHHICEREEGISTICGEMNELEISVEDNKKMINITEAEISNKEIFQKEINTDTTISSSVTDMRKMDDSLQQRKISSNSPRQVRKISQASTVSASVPNLSHKKKSLIDVSIQLLTKEKTPNVQKSKSLRQTLQANVAKWNANENSNTNNGESQRWKKSSRKMSKLDHKTTIIAFLVTIVFILSYVPYLSLQISKQIVEGMDYDLQGAPLILYNIFLRSYYINSISNPIIYGLLNNRFRHQLHILLSQICKICRKNTESQ